MYSPTSADQQQAARPQLKLHPTDAEATPAAIVAENEMLRQAAVTILLETLDLRERANGVAR